MPTELISIGVPTTVKQNIVYATPARAHILHAKAAVVISDEVGGTFVALTNAESIGAPNAGAFVKCTSADIVVTCKPY